MKKRTKEEAREYMRDYRARSKAGLVVPRRGALAGLSARRSDAEPEYGSNYLVTPIWRKQGSNLIIKQIGDFSSHLIELLRNLGYTKTN